MAPRRGHVLATILYTDIVGSTRLAAELGDRRWRVLLARHHLIVRGELKRHRGREIDNAGDGFLASFDDQERAIRCAISIVEAVRVLGIEVRAGLHVGQAEVLGRKLGGIVVNAGARVMAEAGPGQILVTSVLRDLVPGSGFGFEHVGDRELKGLDGTWSLFAVTAVDGESLAPPLEAAEASSRVGSIVPPPLVQRPWGRVAIGVLAVALLLTAVLVVVSRDAPVEIQPNSVLRIDPESGEVLDDIPIGQLGGEITSTPIEVPGHEVWVLSSIDKTISVIDVRSDAAERFGIAARGPRIGFGIAYLDGSVWVTGGHRTVLELAAGREPFAKDEIGIQGFPSLITADSHRIWVLSDTMIVSIDPATGKVSPLHGGIGGGDLNTKAIASGADSLWLSENSNGILYRVDEDTGRTIAISVEAPGSGAAGGPSGITVAFGYVWVSDPINGFVYRIDPESNDVIPWVRFAPKSGYEVSGIAEGGRSLWVASPKTNAIVEIDPFSKKVLSRQPLPYPPQAVTDAYGDVWVTIAPYGA